MREIHTDLITQVVEKLCIEANLHLPEDVKSATSPTAKRLTTTARQTSPRPAVRAIRITTPTAKASVPPL